MMKKLICLIALAIINLTFLITGYSASSETIAVSATVPEALELSYWIRWAKSGQDPYEFGHSGDASAIEFGNLQWNEQFSIWMPDRYYTVFLVARTSGRPYQIKQSCSGLWSGSNNLNESFVVSPDYVPEDELGGVAQGPIPSGDSEGSTSLATGEVLIYDSNSGLSRIVRAYYGLASGEPGSIGSPITGDYPAGTYTGTVAFTLTLK